MTPSLRSHPNHPQQPISLPYTRFVRGNGYDSGHWLRHLLAGSPLLQTESGSLSFGTTGPPRAAPHPVSRRRSCLRLLSRCSSRDDSDFHWLISYMCVRTSMTVSVVQAAGRGLIIDEVAAPVSFTVETTVLPSFALPRDCCSGVCMGLRFGSHRQPLQTRAAARYSYSLGVFVVQGYKNRKNALHGFAS